MTLRRSIGLVALAALALFAYEEFQDGSPPRFVVRSIPDRIARLRPGMTYEEAEAILGLEKSWLRGGLSPDRLGYIWHGPSVIAINGIGQPRHGPNLQIYLAFTTSPPEDGNDWRRSETTRLENASLRVGSEIIAQMRK